MPTKRDLFWRLRLLGWREIWAILIVAALAAAGIAAMMLPYNGNTNFGFGPEWECTSVAQGDPVCVKRGAAAASD
jgi:hypothetical protein